MVSPLSPFFLPGLAKLVSGIPVARGCPKRKCHAMCPDILGGTSYCGGIPQSVRSPTFAATPLHGGTPPEESIISYRSSHFFRSVGPPDCNHDLESELHSLWQDTPLGISSCLSYPLSSFRFTLGLCSQKLEQTDPQGLWFMASV